MSAMTADELRAWSREVDGKLIGQAVHAPACWGGQFCVAYPDLYVTEDTMYEVLPSERDLDLYYSCAAAEAELPGVTYETIAKHMDSEEWLKETADLYMDSDECIVFYSDLYPADISEQEKLELASERPDLFTPESLANYPNLFLFATDHPEVVPQENLERAGELCGDFEGLDPAPYEHLVFESAELGNLVDFEDTER